MMNIPENYRKPFLVAILVHVFVLILLLINFAASQFRAPPSSSPQQIIHATAIIQHSEQLRTPSISERKLQSEHEDLAKIARQEKIVHQEKIEKQKAALVLKQIETAKLQKLAALKASEAKKLAQAKKLKAEEKKLEARVQENALLAEQKTLKKQTETHAKTNKLLAEQKKLQQQLMQQQLNSEQKNIAQVQSLAQQGVIDKYKAQILATIQSNWRIDKVDSKLKCIYSIALAPNGDVLSVTLVQSSGDTALDQSAQQAIQQSSPLPVPSNPSLFSNFRQLVLTLSPQGYLQNA